MDFGVYGVYGVFGLFGMLKGKQGQLDEDGRRASSGRAGAWAWAKADAVRSGFLTSDL
jgi:hypothetical protein